MCLVCFARRCFVISFLIPKQYKKSLRIPIHVQGMAGTLYLQCKSYDFGRLVKFGRKLENFSKAGIAPYLSCIVVRMRLRKSFILPLASRFRVNAWVTHPTSHGTSSASTSGKLTPIPSL